VDHASHRFTPRRCRARAQVIQASRTIQINNERAFCPKESASDWTLKVARVAKGDPLKETRDHPPHPAHPGPLQLGRESHKAKSSARDEGTGTSVA